MDRTAWIAYLAALLAVLLTPGSSVMLAIAQALQAGRAAALWTVAGDLAANGLQIAVIAIAANTVIAAVAAYAALLKWGAIAFLLVTGLRLFSGLVPLDTPASGRSAFSTGFAVSLSNPAAILFFALLLPLFVYENAAALPQFALLGAVALLLDGAVLCFYIAAALAVARRLDAHSQVTGRIAGGLRLGGAAVLAAVI